MKFTTFTDYSLRVLLYLSSRPRLRATIAEIADSFGISQSHLTKVVHLLGRRGWLATTRGKGGGIALAAPARDIVVGDVVRATEGELAPVACFGGSCAVAGACRLRGVIVEAVDAFDAVLDRYTLADLVAADAAGAALDFKPRPAVAGLSGVSP